MGDPSPQTREEILAQIRVPCTEEQIVDTPVPQFQEYMVKVIIVAPQERISERIREPLKNNRESRADRGRLHARADHGHACVPAAGDDHVERNAQQTADMPASQIQEQIVLGVKITPQELVLLRTKGRSWTCPFPDQGHAAGVRLRAHV